MIDAGDATRLAKDTVLEATAAERWDRYAAAREAKIASGEWAPIRPYSVEDRDTLEY
jgi:hypothetical protein